MQGVLPDAIVQSCHRALVFLFVTPFVTGASAQTTGTIVGTVQDASGGVLPGVTVTVTNTGTGLVRTAVTGGRWPLRARRAARRDVYELRAELPASSRTSGETSS